MIDLFLIVGDDRLAQGRGQPVVANRHQFLGKPLPDGIDRASGDAPLLLFLAFAADQEIFERTAKQPLGRGHAASGYLFSPKLRPQRTQNLVMRKRGAANQTVDLHGFGKPGHDLIRQLAQEALEQDLFIDRKHAHTSPAGRSRSRPFYPGCSD